MTRTASSLSALSLSPFWPLLFVAVGSSAACDQRSSETTATSNTDASTQTTSVTMPRGDDSRSSSLASEKSEGKLETVALFDGPMPTGVAISRSGRIFVSFPRWGDAVDFTVAEVKDGKPVAFPTADMNKWPGGSIAKQFISVQSVVVDPKDRLWVLDTGSVKFAPTDMGGPKLVGIDLATNAIMKIIPLPRNVALPTSYVNDVRLDLKRGTAGMAFITDSSRSGPNGIIVVDLDSGKSWRKLHDHASTKPEKGFLGIVEGRPLMMHETGKPSQPLTGGVDGIAISKNGQTVFYSPLASRRLYSVSADLLANEASPEAQVAATVQDLGDKGASDGLESDAEGRLYVTNYENNAILRRKTDGTYETIVTDPRLLWPDSLALAKDGYLYVTANQLERQPVFTDGKDMRQKPYALFRVKVDAAPLLLQ